MAALVAPRSETYRSGYLLVLLILALGAQVMPTHAQDERVTVRVDGAAVLRVGSLGEIDVATRTQRIEMRIGALLQNPKQSRPP